jgi:hypothetical protein
MRILLLLFVFLPSCATLSLTSESKYGRVGVIYELPTGFAK